MTEALVDQIEIWGFEDDVALFQDMSSGFVLDFEPVDISCSSDEEINRIKHHLKGFLNALPAGTDIQFVQTIDKDRHQTTSEHLKNASEESRLALEIAKGRVQRFNNLDDIGHLPFQKNFLIVRTAPMEKASGILGRFKNSQSKIENQIRTSVAGANRLRAEIIENLKGLGFVVRALPNPEVAQLIFDTWNPGREIGDYDEQDIRDRMVVSELVKDIKGFRLGEYHHRLLTLKELPEQTYAGMVDSLIELPFSSRLHVSIHIPDQAKEMEWLKLNRRIAYAMAAGKKGVSDVESESKLKDIEDLLSEIVQSGEKVLYSSISIVLRSKNAEELDEQVRLALSKFRELSGAEGFLETYASFDVFSESSIPNAKCELRRRRVTSSNAADLVPIYGYWKGTSAASILVRNAQGGLFKFDPFANEFTNSNQIVSGGSGAGKSFLTNLMIGQMLLKDPKVFILDIGGSYRKLCELLNGQYVSLAMDSRLSMNPFDLSPGDIGPSQQKIKFLVGLVELMGQDGEHFGKLERSEIETSIIALYKKNENPRLSNLKEMLMTHENPEIVRVGKILSLWTGSSPFGRMLDQPSTVELEKRVVCFDMKGLESNPELQAVMLYTIMDLIWRDIQRNRSEMKILVLDEVWKLLESDVGSQFVGEVFRTFRKYNASAVAISQNIDDFARSRAANAILPNSSIKWILKQGGADLKRLAEVLRLNEREVALIESLKQVKGEFAEALLLCENRSALVQIESTPLEYWLATTSPKDYALLSHVSASQKLEGLNLLKFLAKQFPTGATDAVA